jgi:hypothetical protein
MSEQTNTTLAAEQDKPRKKMGRPTIYSKQVAARILTRIANGESLRQMTREDDMPGHSTVYEWLLAQPDFADSYARARDEQADTLADEIVAIADEPPAEVVDDKGVARTDSGWVTWQKNRVDARKWVAAKLKPKKYGDRQIVAGDADNPLEIKASTEIFDTVLQSLELAGQKKK